MVAVGVRRLRYTSFFILLQIGSEMASSSIIIAFITFHYALQWRRPVLLSRIWICCVIEGRVVDAIPRPSRTAILSCFPFFLVFFCAFSCSLIGPCEQLLTLSFYLSLLPLSWLSCIASVLVLDRTVNDNNDDDPARALVYSSIDPLPTITTTITQQRQHDADAIN